MKYSLSSQPHSRASLSNKPQISAFVFAQLLKSSLAPTHLSIILEIKSHFHALGQLRNGISPLIYSAVLNHGATDPQSFLAIHPEYDQFQEE